MVWFKKDPNKQRFDDCRVRTPEFNRYYVPGILGQQRTGEGGVVSNYVVDDPHSSLVFTEAARDELLTEDPSMLFAVRGFGARLHCPRSDGTIQSDETGHYKQGGALKDLRRVAAAAVCENCEFSGLSQTQINLVLAGQADAETELLIARLRQQEVTAELQSRFPDGLTGPAVSQQPDALPPAAG